MLKIDKTREYFEPWQTLAQITEDWAGPGMYGEFFTS